MRITRQAVAYIQQTDSVRYNLLQQYNLSSTLSIGSWNEDDPFDYCAFLGPPGPSGPCYLGRYYFHFLEQPDKPLNSLLQSSTCTSIDWGISGVSCVASSSGPIIGSSPPMTNAHTWSAATSSVDPTTQAPTITGWQHLGYIIHLLEDLTSPPHTRNSGHPCVGGVLFCDPFEPVNVNSDVQLPKRDYLGLGTITTPGQIFTALQQYTHDRYFSARTAFNGDGGPISVYDDLFYYYGACLDASNDFNTCFQVAGQPLRKIAHKGVAWYVSGGVASLAEIDETTAQEQFAELAPVTVQAVASLIEYYAPILTVVVTGSGTVTSNPGIVSCTITNAPCAALFVQGTTVTLTAAATNSNFLGWSGACLPTTNDPMVATVNLTSDQTCTANFTLRPVDTIFNVSGTFGDNNSTPLTGTLTINTATGSIDGFSFNVPTMTISCGNPSCQDGSATLPGALFTPQTATAGFFSDPDKSLGSYIELFGAPAGSEELWLLIPQTTLISYTGGILLKNITFQGTVYQSGYQFGAGSNPFINLSGNGVITPLASESASPSCQALIISPTTLTDSCTVVTKR